MDSLDQSKSASDTVDGSSVIGPAGQRLARADANLRTLSHVVYGLYGLTWFTGGVSGIVGVIIDYIKRSEAGGTYYETHFTWRIRTFWWSFFAFGLSLFMLLQAIPLGGALVVLTWIWVLYRLIKGWLYLIDRKDVP